MYIDSDAVGYHLKYRYHFVLSKIYLLLIFYHTVNKILLLHLYNKINIKINNINYLIKKKHFATFICFCITSFIQCNHDLC